MHETANKFLTIDLTPDCRLMIIKCVIPQLDKQTHFLQLKIYVSQGNHYHHICGNNILLAGHFYFANNEMLITLQTRKIFKECHYSMKDKYQFVSMKSFRKYEIV